MLDAPSIRGANNGVAKANESPGMAMMTINPALNSNKTALSVTSAAVLSFEPSK